MVTTLQPHAVSADDLTAQRIVDAAGRCFERLTPEKTTMDAIAIEAGVSRATVFRRFGNWESIYLELLRQQIRPLVQEGAQFLRSNGPLDERLENATVHTVMNMPRDPRLKAMLGNGLDGKTMERFERVFLEQLDKPLRRMLADGQRDGLIYAHLDLNELSLWYMREFFLLVMRGPWEEAALRRRIQHFLFPVMFSSTARLAASPREALQQARHLAQMQRHLDALQAEVQHLEALCR